MQARLAVRLVRDSAVPLSTKGLLLLAALYLLSPVDLLPDLFPVMGQLDDLLVAILAIETFVGLCPPGARAFHADAIARRSAYSPMPKGEGTIDAEWRRG
jgi:uncharacterized membrane protein YkvA (DUF1232 family)